MVLKPEGVTGDVKKTAVLLQVVVITSRSCDDHIKGRVVITSRVVW